MGGGRFGWVLVVGGLVAVGMVAGGGGRFGGEVVVGFGGGGEVGERLWSGFEVV